MKYLFLHTLIDSPIKDPSARPFKKGNWPRVLGVFYAVTDGNFQLGEVKTLLVKPNTTDADVRNPEFNFYEALVYGVSIESILDEIYQLLPSIDAIVGYDTEEVIGLLDSEFYFYDETCPLSAIQYISIHNELNKLCQADSSTTNAAPFVKHIQAIENSLKEDKIQAMVDCVSSMDLWNRLNDGRIYFDVPKSWHFAFEKIDRNSSLKLYALSNYIFSANYYLNKDFWQEKNKENENIVFEQSMKAQSFQYNRKWIIDYTSDLFCTTELDIKLPSIERKTLQDAFLKKTIQFAFANKKNPYEMKALLANDLKQGIVKVTTPHIFNLTFVGFNEQESTFEFLREYSLVARCSAEDLNLLMNRLQSMIEERNKADLVSAKPYLDPMMKRLMEAPFSDTFHFPYNPPRQPQNNTDDIDVLLLFLKGIAVLALILIICHLLASID